MKGQRVLVDFFYDVISPYSWIGFEMITRHQQLWKNDVQVRLRPALIAFIMKAAGNKALIQMPAKAANMTRDVERLNRFYKIPITIPKDFATLPFNVKPMRMVTAVDILSEGQHTEAISRELFKRIFAKHEDIFQLESIKAAGRSAGLDQGLIESAIADIDSPATKDRLKGNTDEAIRHEAFGLPTIVAHLPSGPQMFFGSDRIELLAHALGVKYGGALHDFSKV